MTDVATHLTDLLSSVFGPQLPVRVRCWDGSECGPAEGPTVVLRSPAVLRHLLWAPGEIGLARAYVSGDLDVDGDLTDGLRRVWAASRRPGTRFRPTPLFIARAARTLGRLGAYGRRPPVPASESQPNGRHHSKPRDARAIRQHYDASSTLYRLLLDEQMAYSCGYWTRSDLGYTLDDAQRDKLDLICRKLDLRPGARLLDVGCGWGSLAIFAAREYGAHVTGITLSSDQLAIGRERVTDEGLEHAVELRLQDYRDLESRHYDAITAIEMGEHVGAANYPRFLDTLHRALRAEGRLLIQQMSRNGRHPGGGPFIERYIVPDMHMRPLGETIGLITAAGFEVRDVHALREHYVRTIRAWQAELERGFNEIVSTLGTEQARVWRLYLAGGALAFEQNRMGVDQILAVRATDAGRSGMPDTRLDWEPLTAQPATL